MKCFCKNLTISTFRGKYATSPPKRLNFGVVKLVFLIGLGIYGIRCLLIERGCI